MPDVVSCLCVSRGIPRFLQGAVDCFERQTYPLVELVVVFEGSEGPSDECYSILKTCQRPVVIVSEPDSPRPTLGDLRNRAVSIAVGDYICQWDDDDWHAPTRVERQLHCLRKREADACFLSRWTMYDETSTRAWLSPVRLWEGSLFASRTLPLFARGYPSLRRGEDTPLVRDLVAQCSVCSLNAAELYVYRYHGQNAWSHAHFVALASLGVELAPYETERIGRLFKPCDQPVGTRGGA